MNAYNAEALAVVKILGLLQFIIFVLDVVLYSFVWLTILQSSRRLRQFNEKETTAPSGENQQSSKRVAKPAVKKNDNKGKSYAGEAGQEQTEEKRKRRRKRHTKQEDGHI